MTRLAESDEMHRVCDVVFVAATVRRDVSSCKITLKLKRMIHFQMENISGAKEKQVDG